VSADRGTGPGAEDVAARSGPGPNDPTGTPGRRVLPPPPVPHHRNVQGGAARAAVFGVSDGLVTNISLILGVAGANTAQGYVRLAGFAGLLAGAFSMAAGEFISVNAQKELVQRELDMEALELRRSPVAEHRELSQLYESRGIEPELARRMAREMMRTPEMALETHAREELGVNPSSLGSPLTTASSSFASFAIGAAIPLIPWFFIAGGLAIGISLGLVALAALGVGALLARFTGRSAFRSCLRQLIVTMLAAGAAFAVGRVVGVSVGG
jgi:VIT1/CCC1 family predicted Fe2+/Mn2+ transporter